MMLAPEDILPVSQPPNDELVASVVVPAKNESASLPRALEALALQEDMPPRQYEVLLLINNCTDDSLSVAKQFQSAHPWLNLHVIQKDLPSEKANIGLVRRLLMNTACVRLRESHATGRLILSTDADTEVAADWIAQNRKEVLAGAGAVGGIISLRSSELTRLPERTRRIRALDDRYRTLVAWLEHQCDPVPHDPWPRHYHHFGGSLAVTPSAYDAVGGLPPEQKLEDLAFYERLLSYDIRFRHSPDVVVYTSARLEGRTAIGLAEQLSAWDKSGIDPFQLPVPSVTALRNRYAARRRFRHECTRPPGGSHKPANGGAIASLLCAPTGECDAPFFGQLWREFERTLGPLPSQGLESAVRELETAFFQSQVSQESTRPERSRAKA